MDDSAPGLAPIPTSISRVFVIEQKRHCQVPEVWSYFDQKPGLIQNGLSTRFMFGYRSIQIVPGIWKGAYEKSKFTKKEAASEGLSFYSCLISFTHGLGYTGRRGGVYQSRGDHH